MKMYRGHWYARRDLLARNATAVGFALALGLSSGAFAQSNVSGSIYGSAPAGSVITVRDTATGYTQQVKANKEGAFNFSSLPVGQYEVQAAQGSETFSPQVVSISIGTGVQVSFGAGAAVKLEGVTVRSSKVAAVDVSSVESATNLTARQLAALPINRTSTAVQLLAPDAIQGDGAFTTAQGQPLVSFGGSSPLENAYFLNGFNITDFRKGLGGSEVPFEFYKDVQVKTGGYSAEFGRSLGGVVNAVSKTGTNKFEAGIDAFWQPKQLYSQAPDYYYTSSRNGKTLAYRLNGDDEREVAETNVYVGGPILKDRIFFYGVVAGKYTNQTDLATFGTSSFSTLSNTPGYAFNLAANIAQGHSIDFTTFSDEKKFKTSVSPTDATSYQINGPVNSSNFARTGGQNYIGHYSGKFTDWFSLSATYGTGYQRDYSLGAYTAGGGGFCAATTDRRFGGRTPIGCIPFDANDRDYKDTRDAYRLDGTFSFQLLGDHSLKVGYDKENLKTVVTSSLASAERILRCVPASGSTTCKAGTATVQGGQDYVYLRQINQMGNFKNELEAYYAEDTWRVGNFTLVGGLRVDTFDLKGGNGDSFIKSDNLYGPRFGLAWDVMGDGKSKVFANWGRYYIPIETNTAYRNTAIGSDLTSYYQFNGIDPSTGAVLVGPQISPPAGQVLNGTPTPYSKNLQATSQDEYIIGAQVEVAPKWAASIKGTYRNLRNALEDSCAFNPNDLTSYGCFLWNPGTSLTGVDYTGDGVVDPDISAAALGFPKLKRRYYGLETAIERVYDRKWFFKASYTISHTYGNFEGFSQSDIGQDDSGITIAFDFPQLTTNTYGDLPNDRRHKFKAYGAYNFTQDISAGLNYSLISGRPRNRLGIIPNPSNDPALDQVNSFYDGQGFEVARGTNGRTPWVSSLDFSLKYNPEPIFAKRLTVGVDVLNLLDHSAALTQVDSFDTTDGPIDYYGLPSQNQAPRFVRFSVSYNWKQ